MSPLRRTLLAAGLVIGGVLVAGSSAQAGVNVSFSFGGGYCGPRPVYYGGYGYGPAPVYYSRPCRPKVYYQRPYCGPRSVTYVPSYAYGNRWGGRCR